MGAIAVEGAGNCDSPPARWAGERIGEGVADMICLCADNSGEIRWKACCDPAMRRRRGTREEEADSIDCCPSNEDRVYVIVIAEYGGGVEL